MRLIFFSDFLFRPPPRQEVTGYHEKLTFLHILAGLIASIGMANGYGFMPRSRFIGPKCKKTTPTPRICVIKLLFLRQLKLNALFVVFTY